MLFVHFFVVVTKKIAKRVHQLHHHFAGCHAPELIATMTCKTTKINFGGLLGLSTKINTHENYPLCSTYLVVQDGRSWIVSRLYPGEATRQDGGIMLGISGHEGDQAPIARAYLSLLLQLP